MNERIRQLAEQAGSTHKQNLGVYQFFTDELEKFAELVAADEREACIEICVKYRDEKPVWDASASLVMTPNPAFAKRKWVGLTDEEMRELEKQFEAERVRTSDEEYLVIYPSAYWQWQRAIEAKLKEKNNV